MNTIEQVNRNLATNSIPASSLISNCRLPLHNDIDPQSLLFFYHLGKTIKPTSLLEIGFDLGLTARSFLTSCKTVKVFLGQNDAQDDYSPRMGKHNIQDKYDEKLKVYVGNVDDEIFTFMIKSQSWDLVVINKNDKLKQLLNLLWSNLAPNGVIILSGAHYDKYKQTYIDFCKVVNRQPQYFADQNKSGVIIR